MLLSGFEVAAELPRHPELAGRPVVVGGLPHERKRVRSRSAEAAASGVEEGMPLRQAQSLCPGAVFLPLDEAFYRERFDRVLEALGTFSPKVEGSYSTSRSLTTKAPRHQGRSVNKNPGDLVSWWLRSGPLGVYLDVSGTELLFGPEGEMGRKIARTVEREAGLSPRIGIASGRFVAMVAASIAAPGETKIVKEGHERSFLTPLPVGLLPCSPEMLRRLHLLGLRTAGQLADLPAGALAEQFRPEGVEIAMLARGEEEGQVVAREIPPLLEEEIEMDPPTARLDLVKAAASLLVDRLASSLRVSYAACREVGLEISLSNGVSLRQATSLHEPTDQPSDLLRAVQRLLLRKERGQRSPLPSWERGWGEGTAISNVRIVLSGLGEHHGEQLGMFRSRAGELKKARRTVRQVEEQAGAGVIRPMAEAEKGRATVYPLRVVADEEGTPRALLLDGRWDRVREISNRWRVAEGWWGKGISREYYRVITERGRLCLVFRDLSPQPRRPNPPPPFPIGEGGATAPLRAGEGSHAWFLERIYA